jgi:hypothetical protein
VEGMFVWYLVCHVGCVSVALELSQRNISIYKSRFAYSRLQNEDQGIIRMCLILNAHKIYGETYIFMGLTDMARANGWNGFGLPLNTLWILRRTLFP